MPLGLDPQQTIEFSIDRDAGIPADKRPIYITRFLTPRKQREILRLVDESWSLDGSDEDRRARALEAMKVSIVGWRNVRDEDGNEIPFSWQAADDVLSFQERRLIAIAAVTNTTLRDLDFFSSGSPASSAPAKSADDAAAGAA